MADLYDTPYGETGDEPGFWHRLDSYLNRFFRPGTRDWAAACHFAPLVALVIPIPGLGALIAWAILYHKRNVEPGVGEQGTEALNFQINVAFWTAMGMAFFLIPAVLVQIAAAALAIIAGVATFRGEVFRYPWILRPIR